METKRTIGFGKIDWNGSGRKINELEMEMRLEDADGEKPVFAASLMVWNSRHTDILAGGQMLDNPKILKAMFLNVEYKKALGLWKRNHLNDMHAGTPEQEKFLADHENEREAVAKELFEAEWNAKKAEFGYSDDLKDWWMKEFFYHAPSHYDISCEMLRRGGLYEVQLDGKPYKYGHSWLYQSIPEEDLTAIKGFLGMEMAA